MILYKKIQLGFTIFCLCLLTLLFILPSFFVSKDEIYVRAKCDEAMRALDKEDYVSAKYHCDELHAHFHKRADRLGFFLNHSLVEAVDAAIAEACKLAEMEDPSAAGALVRVQHAMEMLMKTECFRLGNIL
ncbi:MAG: DUF4363 family protein [Clostridiales bacterium]|nr:DUF4363 family protein [Clostridiales bacterium]